MKKFRGHLCSFPGCKERAHWRAILISPEPPVVVSGDARDNECLLPLRFCDKHRCTTIDIDQKTYETTIKEAFERHEKKVPDRNLFKIEIRKHR